AAFRREARVGFLEVQRIEHHRLRFAIVAGRLADLRGNVDLVTLAAAQTSRFERTPRRERVARARSSSPGDSPLGFWVARSGASNARLRSATPRYGASQWNTSRRSPAK